MNRARNSHRFAISLVSATFFVCLSSLTFLAAASWQRPAEPGDFDFYLFTLSWSPQFCASHKTNPECAGPGKSFVVHGLWPQWNNGQWPANCSKAVGPTSPEQYSDLMESSLLQHEWTKHGTCANLDADQYFSLMRAVRESVTIPRVLGTLNHQIAESPQQIKTAFVSANPKLKTEGIAIGCANGFLVDVEFCFDKSGKPISCPVVKDCRNGKINIRPMSP
ncbi:MAG TPA: ribonuclease T2 [Terracidiphilus sp.]|nr:ribonuclease T2 [Terracidiphilus sp.]